MNDVADLPPATPQDHAVVLFKKGKSVVEIAAEVNLSPKEVFDVVMKATSGGSDFKGRSLEVARERLRELGSVVATERLITTAADPDAPIPWAVRAADSILDRSGIGRVTGVAHFTPKAPQEAVDVAFAVLKEEGIESERRGHDSGPAEDVVPQA